MGLILSNAYGSYYEVGLPESIAQFIPKEHLAKFVEAYNKVEKSFSEIDKDDCYSRRYFRGLVIHMKELWVSCQDSLQNREAELDSMEQFWLECYFEHLYDEGRERHVGLVNRQTGNYYYLSGGQWELDGNLPSLRSDTAIYQATKHIFVEEKAKIRNLAPVKRWINCHLLTGSPLQQIVTQYGDEAVYHSVMQLLSDKVYESTTIASQRFPDLFESSTAQTIARAQLEEEATRSEQAALDDITQTHQNDSQNAFNSAETTTAVHDASDSTVSSEVGISSLFLVHLPFPIEHLLMEKLQKILELACYQYGVREIPSIMQKRGWDCPESVELSKWAELLGREENLERQGNGKPLAELLPSITQIRHTAVHRLRTNSTGLERFLTDAEDLAALLGDNIYTKAISQLRLDVRSTLAELTRNKEFIQLELEKAQGEIAKKRTELDEEEQENLRQMKREDEKYRALAGERLEKALHVLGDLNEASKNEDTVLNGMNGDEAVRISDDDSEFDHAEQFEDCIEA